jgi:hypothetical protein
MQKLTKSQVGMYMLENKHVFVNVENEMWYLKAIKHHKSGVVLIISQDDKEKNYYPGSNEILEFYTNEYAA